MLSDEFPGAATKPPSVLGGTTGYVFLYVPDVDRTFAQAVAAGARVTMPLADMFWGDRFGTLVDPFGHAWGLATHKEDVPPREMAKRAQAATAQMGQTKT
jgi:PhnB protein